MKVDAVLDILQRSGVTVVAEGDRLRAMPATALNDELRGLIREHKEALVRLIALPAEVEHRLARMVKTGAIDSSDAAQVRARYHAYPAEWDLLLDCCERAVTER